MFRVEISEQADSDLRATIDFTGYAKIIRKF